jgi:8-oxo-dGTP pyrophosphatase MutT (NUDIX family)
MVFTVPDDGLCLSTFLVLRPTGYPGRVLVGRLNPDADWVHIGAIDARRAAMWSKGWMLPSSQLIYYESPDESARRVAREQLGIELANVPSPIVMADTDYRASAAEGDLHWDFGFIYLLDGYPESPPHHPAWSELEFVEVSKTPRQSFVRSQGDVLERVGLIPAG